MSHAYLKMRTDPLSTVSLFLKWFLCRATLEENGKVRQLFEQMDRAGTLDRQKWADRLRERLSKEALRALSAILERPLNEYEWIYLFEKIEEFIQPVVLASGDSDVFLPDKEVKE